MRMRRRRLEWRSRHRRSAGIARRSGCRCRAVSRGPVANPTSAWLVAPVPVDHRGRDDEERDRHGDLENHERVAPPLSNAIGCRDRAQRVRVQPARFVQRWRDAGGDARPERDDGCLHEDAHVDREIEEALVPAVSKDPRRAARRSRRRRGCRRRPRPGPIRSEASARCGPGWRRLMRGWRSRARAPSTARSSGWRRWRRR